MILAIDTTAEFGSIALCDLDRVIEEVPLHAPDGFAHVVFGELESLLMRHGLRAGDIDRYAAASGPGSFTGVRVGLTLVKGLAFATGKKVVAVSNLQALASFGAAELRAPLIEARRGEVYAAVYDANLELVVPEMVTTFDKFIETLAARGPIEFISATTDPALERGRQIVIAPRALAGAIGKIAARGKGGLPENIDANYVRRSDAELFWTDR